MQREDGGAGRQGDAVDSERRDQQGAGHGLPCPLVRKVAAGDQASLTKAQDAHFEVGGSRGRKTVSDYPQRPQGKRGRLAPDCRERNIGVGRTAGTGGKRAYKGHPGKDRSACQSRHSFASAK
jgi:hypothetical protein